MWHGLLTALEINHHSFFQPMYEDEHVHDDDEVNLRNDVENLGLGLKRRMKIDKILDKLAAIIEILRTKVKDI